MKFGTGLMRLSRRGGNSSQFSIEQLMICLKTCLSLDWFYISGLEALTYWLVENHKIPKVCNTFRDAFSIFSFHISQTFARFLNAGTVGSPALHAVFARLANSRNCNKELHCLLNSLKTFLPFMHFRPCGNSPSLHSVDVIRKVRRKVMSS